MSLVLTLKGEEPPKVHFYTVIQKTVQAVAIARRIRFGVSIEREVGFGGFIEAQRVLRVPGVGRTKQKVWGSPMDPLRLAA